MSTSITLDGRRYVIVGYEEYERLQALAGEAMPELPAKDAQGHYPAVETLRVSLARKLIRRRRSAGLTQAELAQRAGVRPETLSRIEHAKHTPSVVTIQRIEGAMAAADAENQDGSALAPRARSKRSKAVAGRRKASR